MEIRDGKGVDKESIRVLGHCARTKSVNLILKEEPQGTGEDIAAQSGYRQTLGI